MIDLVLLREQPDTVLALLKKKDPSFEGILFLEKDKQIRLLQQQVEQCRHQKNMLAKQAQGGITESVRKESIELSNKLVQLEKELATLQQEFENLYLSCPNIPMADIPSGGKEANLVIKKEGKKPLFDFAIKNHIELGEALQWLDFKAAATMTGSNFALYKKDGVKLLYALTMFMLKNNQDHGYEFVLPPYLLNEQSLINAGNFPKFKNEVYSTAHDPYYLIPTAEVALANLYRNHTFMAKELPIRMTSWTSCFRREAGGYGAAERGLIRIHQFEKVELFTYCEPEHGEQELDRMVSCAETILQKLGLHYRISLLAGQDCSFQSAKTFDIEVWVPSQERYVEISSCSNCTDFQARRAGVRFKKSPDSKSNLVYTLNGSSLALPRLMVALMETYQKRDGTIEIPEILRPFLLG